MVLEGYAPAIDDTVICVECGHRELCLSDTCDDCLQHKIEEEDEQNS